MITPKNKLGYITKNINDKGVEVFRFLECKVTKVVVGKKSTKVYTKELYPFDIKDVEGNREMMKDGLIILKTPFVMRDGDSEYFKAVVDDFNKNGCKSILD